jgi:fermentation-respiration switch protein FrsA (DUF1100 family)
VNSTGRLAKAGRFVFVAVRRMTVRSPSSRPDAGSTEARGATLYIAALYGVTIVLRDFAGRAMRPESRAIWWPYAKMTLIGIGIVLLCLYVGMAAVLYVAQRSMMYFPDTAHVTPAQAGFPAAEEVPLTAADGGRSTVWSVAPNADKPVVLYFHGNGGALHYRVERFKTLLRDGVGLVALEYRGFGGNPGNPSEAGLFADAEAAYAYAVARYPAQRLVLWGESLGTGIAVALAAKKPVGRVILEAPFTSAAAVASLRYWYLPVRQLMKDQYRSDELIGEITVPVLILHGVHDHVVPFAMGERMFELARTPNKHIVRFLDGDHEDLDKWGALHAVGRFLAGDLDRPPHP